MLILVIDLHFSGYKARNHIVWGIAVNIKLRTQDLNLLSTSCYGKRTALIMLHTKIGFPLNMDMPFLGCKSTWVTNRTVGIKVYDTAIGKDQFGGGPFWIGKCYFFLLPAWNRFAPKDNFIVFINAYFEPQVVIGTRFIAMDLLFFFRLKRKL